MNGPYRLSELKYIRANYQAKTCKEIASDLNRPVASLTTFIHRNKIKKSLRRKVGDVFIYNDEANGNKRKMIKRKGGYYRFARHVWEEVHGKIPKGMIITFRDNDPLNCQIENLICITRGELLRRNKRYAKNGQTI